MDLNRPLQNVLLPATLCELRLARFDQTLAGIRWPPQQRILQFGADFNQSPVAANLPCLLETLVLGCLFSTRFAVRAFAAVIAAPYP